uniref:Ig-like domain-containing protein n=1 Tax=Aquila chrysaetos chrysaetos TaxID=223781 RepID=A0A663DY31_AQUCH
KGVQHNALLFFVPPRFIQMPTSVVALREGQSTTFECQVVGTPEIHITWYLDGNEVTDQAKYSISFVDGLATLKVTQARVSDSGIYVCEAHNDLILDMYLKSQSPICVANCLFYTLYTSEPARIIEKAKSLKVTERDPVTLECTVAGTPELRIRWYKDGKQLLPSRYYTMSFENNVASFRIEPVSKEDSGTYSFKVENDFGSSTCEAVLTVLGLYCHLANFEVSLECEISGTPPFDVTWYKDRRQIRSSKKYKVTAKNYHTSVRILNVEAADVGEYQCKAQNDVGSDTCFCTVKLKEPPKFLTKINSMTVVVGEPVELQARVEGSQPISVQWLKDKEEVIRESENTKITFMENIATLQLVRTETSNAGKYICQIRNDAGSRECMATLTILGW